MTQFYFRDGVALTDEQNAKVRPGARGTSGCITTYSPCNRCGGRGGADAWKFTGYTCYRCGGHNSMTHEIRAPRVFTAERLIQVQDAADKKEAKALAAKEVAMVKARQEWQTWAEPHADLIKAILAATGNSFLANLSVQLAAFKMLSDKQVEAAAGSIERTEMRKAEGAASEYVGDIKERIEFEAYVIGVYGTDGMYGHTDIVKFKDGNGNLFTWFASDYVTVEHGDRMTIKGTIKKHEMYRDVKYTYLTRCKYTKFTIITPDEAAQAEAVA